MRKKFLLMLICCLLAIEVCVLVVSSCFLHEIITCPDLCIQKVVDYYPNVIFEVQNKLVDRWKIYCTIFISLTSVSILFTVGTAISIFSPHKVLEKFQANRLHAREKNCKF